MEQGRQINLETVKGKNETFYFTDALSYVKTSFELSVGHMKPQHVSRVLLKCALISLKPKLFRRFALSVCVRYPAPEEL